MLDRARALAGLDWRGAWERWSTALLEASRRRPWALHIPILGPPLTPNNVAWMEQGLRALRDTSLMAGEQLSVIVVLSGMARSDAVLREDLARAARTSALTMGDSEEIDYGECCGSWSTPSDSPR